MITRRLLLTLLFASVSPLLAEDQALAKAARVVVRENITNPVPLTLSLDRSAYKEGELPVITVQTERDCCVTLFYEDAAGTLVQLLPNQFIADNKVKGGVKTQLFPVVNLANANQKVAIEIGGPVFGKEHFIAFAGDDTTPITVASEKAKQAFPLASTKGARVVSIVRRTEAATAEVAPSPVTAATGPLSATGKDGFASVAIITSKK